MQRLKSVSKSLAWLKGQLRVCVHLRCEWGFFFQYRSSETETQLRMNEKNLKTSEKLHTCSRKEACVFRLCIPARVCESVQAKQFEQNYWL